MVNVEASRILLVEDDPNDVELIRLAFADYNFINQMDVVEDGEEALIYLHGTEEIAPQPLPRLVLLDLKLPKLSGIRVLEHIRNNPRTQALVVVVMTSSEEERDLEDCYDLGVNSYIVKPLDFQQFVDVSQKVGVYWMMLNHIPKSFL